MRFLLRNKPLSCNNISRLPPPPRRTLPPHKLPRRINIKVSFK
jgi:hypothetical protein